MKNKIKVVFASPSTQGGGAERIQLNIMNSLSTEKYDITFINSGTEPKPNDLKKTIVYKQYHKKYSRKCFWDLLFDLREINPKYVFTTSIVIAYLLQAVKIITLLKYKLIVRIAVPPSELPQRNLKSRILNRINSATLKYANVIIAQTEFSKIDIAKHYNVPINKIRVIQNIVDKEMLENNGNKYFPVELKKDNYNIVASGALYSVKGFDLLINAIKVVAEENRNVRLFILGDERYEVGYKNILANLIIENSLQNIVFLLGYKSNPYPYYKHADLFVMSSRTEGFPNVVLESLYYGTPVVATNCVDFSSIINNGINGFVVNKGSYESISDGIKRAIVTLGKSNKYTLDNFNYEMLFV